MGAPTRGQKKRRFIVKSRHTPPQSLDKRFPNSPRVDLTSRAPEPWVRFSPFYPHGEIPVPLSPGRVGQSVEGIWQGLKVFERAGVDLSALENTTMRRLKRTVRKYGRCLGHQAGVDGEALLGYLEARHTIYLPAYRWVLDHELQRELAELRELAARADPDAPIVLLDYETNVDVNKLDKPLSHAGLVMRYLEGSWPTRQASAITEA